MATNEILPFAGTDNGTNLLTQAQYNADAQRLIGNAPGVARLELVNKVLRQTSLMSAGLAQFIADLQQTGMVDTLTPAQVATALRLANVGNGTSIYAVAGGTANAITATFSPARPAHQEGVRLYIKLAANNTGAATVNINGLGAVNLVKPGGAALASGDLKSGDIICIVYNGTTYEVVSGINLFSRIGSTGPASCRNKINNPKFAINQRGVSGTVTLAAGAFGHDRWKAGTSGCTYTFSTTDGRTTLNITAGSLVQTIEGCDLPAGVNTMCLSWGGTCQGKLGAGGYGASGLTGEATGGTNISVEFGTGTLYEPQLEIGIAASVFDCLPDMVEEERCQRYLPKVGFGAGDQIGSGLATSATAWSVFVPLRVKPRSAPTGISAGPASTFRVLNNAGTPIEAAHITFALGGLSGCRISGLVASGLTAGNATILQSLNANGYILFTGAEI